MPSTTDDYARGIATALTDLFVAGHLSAAAIDEVIHGTTVATNAILQHRGARTGLITTQGFRDVLELRRLRMPEMYNLLYEKPVPLVERRLRREVSERIGARGEIIEPLDESGVRAEADLLTKSGVESIAVCLLNSYANPVHERRIGEILAELDPHVSVSLSCDVLPEVREYERTSTTVINAYVRPVVQEYLQSLLHRLAGIGVHAPLLVMQSNGGILSVRSAMQRPVQIVESGPAAGVVAPRRWADRPGPLHGRADPPRHARRVQVSDIQPGHGPAAALRPERCAQDRPHRAARRPATARGRAGQGVPDSWSGATPGSTYDEPRNSQPGPLAIPPKAERSRGPDGPLANRMVVTEQARSEPIYDVAFDMDLKVPMRRRRLALRGPSTARLGCR